MNFPWKRLAFGLFALASFGAILVVGYGPGPEIEAEPVARPCVESRMPGVRGVLASVHLEPAELPVIEPLPLWRLDELTMGSTEIVAREVCRAEGGSAFVWTCRECPMRCFGPGKCDRSGCDEGPELWAVDP